MGRKDPVEAEVGLDTRDGALNGVLDQTAIFLQPILTICSPSLLLAFRVSLLLGWQDYYLPLIQSRTRLPAGLLYTRPFSDRKAIESARGIWADLTVDRPVPASRFSTLHTR